MSGSISDPDLEPIVRRRKKSIHTISDVPLHQEQGGPSSLKQPKLMRIFDSDTEPITRRRRTSLHTRSDVPLHQEKAGPSSLKQPEPIYISDSDAEPSVKPRRKSIRLSSSLPLDLEKGSRSALKQPTDNDDLYHKPSGISAGKSTGKSASKSVVKSAVKLAVEDIDPNDPLPAYLVPRIEDNPFIRSVAMTRFRLADDITMDEDEKTIASEIQSVMESMGRGTFAPVPLTTARDISFFDTSVESGHDDQYFFLAALLIINRFHFLTDDHIARFIIPRRWKAKDPLRQLHTERVRKQHTTYQRYVLKVLIKGFADLVVMTGRKQWEASTHEQRARFFDLVYKTGPYTMISMSIGRAATVVPLSDLFSDRNSVLHSNWQTFHKTMLSWSLEAVWEFVIEPQDKSPGAMAKLYKEWKSLPTHPAIKTLELGDVEDIPVKRTGYHSLRSSPMCPRPWSKDRN